VATLREKGAMDYTVLVVTEGDAPPGLLTSLLTPPRASPSFLWKRGGMC